jgi:phosphoribosyl-ATP pyrophosphohydrolase/phosphoribosyl-AMP cyclohydrolase
MSWVDSLKFDDNGLIPVVAQESTTGEVLMVAYANREALDRTLRTGRAHYWSRSRGSLWQKGETSGHIQAVEEVRIDCDGDAVLYRVRQTGPACHTGEQSCFYRRPEGGELVEAPGTAHILSRVEQIIRTREAERPEGSYTTYLFTQGIDKILKKIGEESTETVIAAKNEDAAELRAEAADLLFHLLVLLRARNVDLDEIWAVLEARFGAPTRTPGTATKHPHS